MLFLYLHGFNSSPNSVKAKKLNVFLKASYPESKVVMPQLSVGPEKVLSSIDKILSEPGGQKFLIGSSLGGLIARYLTETREDIAGSILIKKIQYIEREQYHPELGRHYQITNKHLDFVQRLTLVGSKNQSKYLLLCQKDDQECLWEESREVLPEADFYLGEGQGHGFENIEVAFDHIQGFIDKFC